jgi:hypothetical protein
MALVSPGVQVTVIDESQYIPSAVNTVPYFVIATAQNKVSGAGVGVASGTLKANANKTYLITSQRDLTATFGVPFFYNTTTGTPINGYELNEYGLLAAYSSLGISNRAYVQRVDIDLTELTASLSRPIGTPNNNTYWFDTSTTTWGIQEWNQTTNVFTVKTPIAITDTAQVDGDDIPLTTVGSIGDYAVAATTIKNIGYFKTPGNSAASVAENTWVEVGSNEWQVSWPTIAGGLAPTQLTEDSELIINEYSAVVPTDPDNTVEGYVDLINSLNIPGVFALLNSGRLYLYADSTAMSNDVDADGKISIEPGTGGAALLTALGITAGTYACPQYLPSYSYQAPRWRTTDTAPRPTGSVWNNVSAVNNGMKLAVKSWSTTLGTWVTQTTNVYSSISSATYSLDPSGGGKNISVGTTIALYDADFYNTDPNSSMSFEIFRKAAIGQTVVTGTVANPTFGSSNSFSIIASEAGTTTTNTATVTVGGTTVAAFISAVSAANVPYVSASVNSAGNLVFTHSQGGYIQLKNLNGSPLTTAGFVAGTTTFVSTWPGDGVSLMLSNFVTAPTFTYTANSVAPYQDPDTGRLWYYSAVDEVDIMIQNNGDWVGYQNCSNDVRGFDLTLTNATGPIIAATAPTTQNDIAQSPLEYGDLWIDSSDLENYPKIYRWEQVSGEDQWVAVDTTDQVTQNGVLFADARWAPNGTTDPVSAPIPSIVSLLTSNYLDLDAPEPSLYPQGMLLWNTRRSGYNVKSFQANYFTTTNFPDQSLPTVTSTWLTASGNKANGSMYAGRLAQRQMIVEAMKSGLDTSLGAREDTTVFTLIATPAYPELIPNMIALSNERNNTLFVVGDTPMRLNGNTGSDLVTWATNNNGLGLPTEDGQFATSNYAATFYPSCTTTDLNGNTVVQPPSHMMIRTIIRSDEVSYPWLAPAGTRRGVVDNAIQIGYIDSITGEFQPLGVNQAMRDVLYENNVNPITFIPGIGITNFGNKTSRAVTTALDRINVARLVAFLRGRLEEIGKLYLFEPNDQITRQEIANTCNSLMIDLIAKRAIYDYLVVCDLSNNTPARIDRNELWVDIAIEPVKAAEFIYIPLRIKNTGEIAAGA